MKKTLTMMALLGGAVTGYSQGQVAFTDYSGTMQIQVFPAQSSSVNGATATVVTYGGHTTSEYVGSTAQANSIPAGSATYSGTGLSGTGYDAQLFASATVDDSIADLTPEGGVLHFYTTSAAAGFIKGSSTDTVPVAFGAQMTYAVAAWVNSGANGAASTLAQAQVDGYAWGFSSTAVETVTSPSGPVAAGPLSFSLGAVPEPSTIALGVMGASTLLFRRRK